LVKLLENTFRAVNVGLVNEIALMCDRLGIDVWEVVRAAATKPFGFMPFFPGPGLGGHCIPIDPFYLSWKARQTGFEPRFIELAGQINGANRPPRTTSGQRGSSSEAPVAHGVAARAAGGGTPRTELHDRRRPPSRVRRREPRFHGPERALYLAVLNNAGAQTDLTLDNFGNIQSMAEFLKRVSCG
jgi:hypothetical protein